ncbi:MAG: hypothetical protein WD668_07750, partial [Saccharospirillum sp.]
MTDITVAETVAVSAMYHFVRLNNYADYRQPLLDFMEAEGIRGTLLLASEGINGTVAGRPEAIEQLLGWIKSQGPFANLSHKESFCD